MSDTIHVENIGIFILPIGVKKKPEIVIGDVIIIDRQNELPGNFSGIIIPKTTYVELKTQDDILVFSKDSGWIVTNNAEVFRQTPKKLTTQKMAEFIRKIIDHQFTLESLWVFVTNSKKYKLLRGKIKVITINHADGKYAILPLEDMPIFLLETEKESRKDVIIEEFVVALTISGWEKIPTKIRLIPK